MKIVLFYHSLISDWNHGNAHFLRGIATELLARGHQVEIYEPEDAWSVRMLLEEQSERGAGRLLRHLPRLAQPPLRPPSISSPPWKARISSSRTNGTRPELIADLGAHRARTGDYQLLFHDTHHRAITARQEMAAYDLRHYDGVLAYGAILRDLYLAEGWTERAWTWHEAADVRVFHPHPEIPREKDLVWVGNWGDDERTAELHEFLSSPAARCGCDRGVRRALSGRRPSRARGGRDRVRRLAAQLPCAGGFCPLPLHRPRAAPALRGSVARHPHDPPLRSARLRHPDGAALRGTTPRGFSPRGRTISLPGMAQR